jgi:hypothetical protein
MSEDCHDTDYQDPRHLTDGDLASLEDQYEDVENDTELFKLCIILMNTFEEGATELLPPRRNA